LMLGWRGVISGLAGPVAGIVSGIAKWPPWVLRERLALLVQQSAELFRIHLRVAHQVSQHARFSVRWSGTVRAFLEGSVA